MPTLGWILEGDVERYWERQPQPALTPIAPPVFLCSLCRREFFSPEQLHRHQSQDHLLELPALYAQGKPLARKAVLRSTVEKQDVELFQCSYCDVRIDGAAWQRFTLSEFCARFAQANHSTWTVHLVNERAAGAARAEEHYEIRFRIAAIAELDAVDELFVRTLAVDELKHADLKQFEDGLRCVGGPAKEYGRALADYALAIILKERRHVRNPTGEFKEFIVKMRSALEITSLFDRPVALAVSSSIRFNLNDYHDYGAATATELEGAFQFFRSITSGSATEQVTNLQLAPQHTSLYAICPVDQVSHRILLACQHLTGGTLSLAELEALRQLMRGALSMSEHDRVKLHVICAEGYMRLAHSTDALPHLRAVQFDMTLKDWAKCRLEESATDGH